jgi:hypothetical protein
LTKKGSDIATSQQPRPFKLTYVFQFSMVAIVAKTHILRQISYYHILVSVIIKWSIIV